MQELVDYIQQYCGLGKVYRAFTLSKKTQYKQLKNELVQLSLQYCKEENLPGYYDLIIKELKSQPQQQDQDWFNSRSKEIKDTVDQKQQEINQYKSQKNNVSARLSIIELGKIYLKAGYVYDSARSFEKANLIATQTDSIIDYVDDYSQALLFNNEFDKLNQVQIHLHGLKPNQIELKEKLSVAYLCQLLRALVNSEYQDFIEICKNKLLPDDFPDNINHISTTQDLGNYAVIIGFYKNRKLKQKREFTHFHVLYNNENVSPLIVGSYYSQIAADSYLQMQYPIVLNNLKIILDQQQKHDPFLVDQNEFIISIEKQFLLDYLKPYNKIKIQKIADEFGYDKQILIPNLEEMIKDKKTELNFLIDPIEESLVQKKNEETKKVDTYYNALDCIKNYLHDKQKNILHYRLQQISKDNKEFMDDFGDQDLIEHGINQFN